MRRNLEKNTVKYINKEAEILINILVDRIKRSGMTLQNISAISGLTPAYLSNFLNGKYRAEKIKLETLLVLAKTVGLKIDVQYSDNLIHHIHILDDDQTTDSTYI